MFTSLVRLAVDPWSKRQKPIRVPKVSWFRRYPRVTTVVFGITGACIVFSRFIYEAFFESDRRHARELDIMMLLHQTRWRKEGEPPKNLEEALLEQEMLREQALLEKERQAALAARM